MLGRAKGAVLVGIEARLIDVEVDLGSGLPTIAAVGLPDSAVREGIDRIRAALRHAGFKLPERRIVVNLAPAEVRKHGAALDLPIATALLLASEQITLPARPSCAIVGELGLDGALRPVHGALSIAMAAAEAGLRRLILPAKNAAEAALIPGLEVLGLSTLADLVAVGLGRGKPHPHPDVATSIAAARDARGGPDLAEVRGQATARRALEICAAGGHHLLMTGSPGSGKSMLARRLPGILPALAVEEALQVTRIHSAVGRAAGLVTRRPFRAPHHGVSFAGMTGGGTRIRPGEITLASHGVLYLDELTEFRRDALESLRQPLEEGCITLVRLHAAATLPARFTLVASMNPCRCGWHGSPDGRCECTPREVQRYRSRLSGPLLDRFDLVVRLPPVALDELSAAREGESSAAVRARVEATRARQRQRFAGQGPPCNARMEVADLERWAPLGPAARRTLVRACERFGITARGFDRVRRVARTLADMEPARAIEARHVAEALQYRHPDPG